MKTRFSAWLFAKTSGPTGSLLRIYRNLCGFYTPPCPTPKGHPRQKQSDSLTRTLALERCRGGIACPVLAATSTRQTGRKVTIPHPPRSGNRHRFFSQGLKTDSFTANRVKPHSTGRRSWQNPSPTLAWFGPSRYTGLRLPHLTRQPWR